MNTPDAEYLKKNATSIVTHWFVDCVYYGESSNFTFDYKYDKPDKTHVIEALVVAGFEPITTPAPTTTSTTSTTTTTTKSTTTTPTTTTTTPKPTTGKTTETTSKSVTLSNSIDKVRSRREANATASGITNVDIKSNDTKTELAGNMNFPFVCMNKTEVTPDPKKVYGYFSKEIITKGNFYSSNKFIFCLTALKRVLEQYDIFLYNIIPWMI